MAPKDDDDSIKTTPAANVISNSATRDMAQRASEQNPFYAGNVEASSTTGTSMALTYSRKLGYRTKEQEELEGRLGVARQKREQYAVARQVYVQEVEQARLEQRKINEQALYQQIGSPESAIYKTATGTAQEFQRRFRGLAEHEVVLEQQIQKQQEFRGKIGYAYLESAMSRISSPESIRGDVARAANERNIRIASLLATQQPGYDPARAYSTASERLSTVYASMEELKVNRPEYLKTKEGAKELMALAKQEQGLIGQMGVAKGAEAVMHRRGVTFEQVYEQAAVNQYHAGLTSGGSREAAKMGAERGWTVGGKIKESKIIADIVDIETLKARQETSLLERTKGLSPEEAVKEGKPFADSINKFNKELGIAGDLLKKYNETQKETIQTIGKWATAGGAVGAGVSAITGAYRQYSYGVGLESQRTQTGYLGFANQQIQDNRSMYQGDIGAAVRVMTGMYGQAKARGVEIRDKEDIAAKGELVSDAITGVANTAATMASTAPLGPWVSGIATASKATEVIAGVGTQTYRIAQGVPQAQAGLSGMQSEMAYRMAAAQPKIDLMQKYQDTMMRTVGAFTGMGFQRAKPGDINTVDILKELGNLGLGEEQVGSTVSGAVRALGTYSSAGGVRAAARTGAKLQRAGVMGAEEYTQGVLGTLMGGGARSESEVKEILSKAIKAGFDGSVTANALLQSASAARQLMSGSALSGINIGGSIGNTLAQTMGFAGAGGVSKELRAAAAADILGERERLGSGAGLTLGNLSMMSALQRRGVTGLGATAVMNMSPKELEAITSGLRSNDPKRRAEAMQTINNRGLGDVFTQQNIGKKGWLSEIEATKRSQVVYNQTGFMGQATLSTEEYIRQSQLPEGERTQAYREMETLISKFDPRGRIAAKTYMSPVGETKGGGVGEAGPIFKNVADMTDKEKARWEAKFSKKLGTTEGGGFRKLLDITKSTYAGAKAAGALGVGGAWAEDEQLSKDDRARVQELRKISGIGGAETARAGAEEMTKLSGTLGGFVTDLKESLKTADFSQYVTEIQKSALVTSGLTGSINTLTQSVNGLITKMGGTPPSAVNESTDNTSRNRDSNPATGKPWQQGDILPVKSAVGTSVKTKVGP